MWEQTVQRYFLVFDTKHSFDGFFAVRRVAPEPSVDLDGGSPR